MRKVLSHPSSSQYLAIMNAGIGSTVRRKEDLRLVTGHGCYSDDFNFPGQVYGAVVRSPHAHALIRSVDTAEARAMPGVLAVLTGADTQADGLKRIPHLTAPGTAPDIVLHNRDGSPVPAAPHLCYRRIACGMSAPPSPSSSPKRSRRRKTPPRRWLSNMSRCRQ